MLFPGDDHAIIIIHLPENIGSFFLFEHAHMHTPIIIKITTNITNSPIFALSSYELLQKNLFKLVLAKFALI